MNDLLDEYFQRDLTEEEESQLADRLTASQEDSQRMIWLMEELYRSIGLPNPVWVEKPALFLKKNQWRFVKPLFILLLLFLTVFFSVSLWNSKMRPLALQAVKPNLPTFSSVSPHKTSLKKTKNQEPPIWKNAPPPLNPATPPIARTSFLEISPALGGEPSLPRPQPTLSRSAALTPETIPLSPSHSRQGYQLLIVVQFQKAGWTTVQVLDTQKSLIRKLYAGTLSEGSRRFTWDGKTDRGQEAPSGDYFIEVRSGEDVIHHGVHVESTGRIKPF